MLKSNFTKQDVKVSKEEVVFRGYLAINKYHLQFRLFEGGWSNTITRESLLRPQVAVVLLYDPEKDVVVLVEQIRGGLLGEEISPWMLEPVAGIIEPRESAVDAAKRECLEESGYRVDLLEKICHYWVSPGTSNERVMLYCGRIQANHTDKIFGIKEEQENIKPHIITFSKCLMALKSGIINNASAIIALQWLEINHLRIRSEWV